MSGNATHFIIHNHFDSSSFHFTGMICCVILISLVVVSLVILIGVSIYVIIHSEKCRRRPRKESRTERSKRRPERYAFENIIDDTSACNVNSQASTARDLDEGNNPNAESIPLTVFESRTTDQRDRVSESSAGLYDVFFPDQNNCEILHDPPRNLMAFAGQVYASNRDSDRARDRADPEAGPSGSGLNCEAASVSLEWDYFQENSPVATESSDIDLEVDPTKIYDVCWV